MYSSTLIQLPPVFYIAEEGTNDASAKSGDLSRANQELREKVSELEKLITHQKSQSNQYLGNRTALNPSRRVKVCPFTTVWAGHGLSHCSNNIPEYTNWVFASSSRQDLEAEIKSLEEAKAEYKRRSYEQVYVQTCFIYKQPKIWSVPLKVMLNQIFLKANSWCFFEWLLLLLTTLRFMYHIWYTTF